MTNLPSFLTIKARQIEIWADQIDARSHLSVLLRMLVHSTGRELHQVDFPGYDNAQRHGPDGVVKSGVSNPWIPEGVSYWEFGTNKKPHGKAEKDYSDGLKSIDPDERANSTFVFVTPRNWPGKTAWENQKNETGDWKEVRAFDASDLEQWLERAVLAQIWLAEQLGQPTSGYETLGRVWHRWANVSEPHLTPEIFASSVAAYQDRFKNWLDKPSEKPFVVAADSRDEALAFLACLFDNKDLRQFEDRAAVFTSPETLKTLVASSVNFIPIVHSHDTERELGDAHRRLHCIVFRTRNAVDTKADITLDLLSHDAFEKALTVLGLERDKIERLARESGRSPTVLRRRLSENNAIKKPEWACDDKTAKDLVPMTLIGTWHAESEADREIVSCVADRKYEEIEDDVARLHDFDDSPVWSAGRYRGVTSKIDALYAIASRVISEDLDRFFIAAEYVLSESDPALELPEEKRWAAALYGKKRNYSDALRESICDTLIILSVHGNNLFQSRLGINIEDRVEGLIRRLLTPLTLEKLLSHDHDLPRLAEAAPGVFLNLIEEDLRSKDPIVFGLLKPVDSTWASPSRTGLLWALECLAWKPQNLPRVSLILAQLSQRKINDNWMNKPDDSLQDIFRSWIPQTASSVGDRVKVLEMLNKRFPDIGWAICLAQIQSGSQTAFPNYRPRWRSDASGAGQVVTNKERYDFDRKALDLLIAWPSHDEKTLGDLIESLSCMSEKDQTKVWDLIQKWSQNATESAKAVLRERIRCSAFSRPSRRKLEEATRDRAREVYESLRPHDPVIRHGCLFANPWVRESADEIEEEDFDPQKHAERIDRLRRDAMTEIWTKCGFQGVKEILADSGAAEIVGQYMSLCVTDVKTRIDFIKYCLSLDGDFQSKTEQCLQGFLISIEEDSCTGVLQTTAKELSAEERVRLFVCAPFQASTWRLLDDYDEDTRAEYWRNVSPSVIRYTSAELTELIDCLLGGSNDRVRRSMLFTEISRISRRPVSRGFCVKLPLLMLNRKAITCQKGTIFPKALDSLDIRPGVTRDEMAKLEFMFIKPLEYSQHGIPNLENQITESPAFFAHVVARIYKRSDEGEDPPEWRIENPKQRAAFASAARLLLRKITKIPGTNDDGKIDGYALAAWISKVRQLCCNYARVDMGDYCIGELLAKAPAGKNGIWPCEAVCKAMEGMASTKIGEGFYFGTRNSRGVIELDEGGKQEHERATKYRVWAEHLPLRLSLCWEGPRGRRRILRARRRDVGFQCRGQEETFRLRVGAGITRTRSTNFRPRPSHCLRLSNRLLSAGNGARSSCVAWWNWQAWSGMWLLKNRCQVTVADRIWLCICQVGECCRWMQKHR